MDPIKTFVSILIDWHRQIDRKLPWKESNDPYLIWVSEIILQQTRVAQGIPYYLRFISRFPTISSLANAREDDILKAWQGLGYYSRARNMHASAKRIVTEFNGDFPQKYEDILSLKGIGPYTAAAIASFAFDQQYGVVDGNVKRVLSRYFGIEDDLNTSQNKKKIELLVQQMLEFERASIFNQAIMDFGALTCIPSPDCEICPLNNQCYAHKNQRVASIPFKPIKKPNRQRYFHYLIIENGNKVHIEKRSNGDIWTGLYQPKLIERNSQTKMTVDEIEDHLELPVYGVEISEEYKHKLSHQDLHIYFYHIEFPQNTEKLSSFNLVDKTNLRNFAFPKIIDSYLEEKSIYL